MIVRCADAAAVAKAVFDLVLRAGEDRAAGGDGSESEEEGEDSGDESSDESHDAEFTAAASGRPPTPSCRLSAADQATCCSLVCEISQLGSFFSAMDVAEACNRPRAQGSALNVVRHNFLPRRTHG